MPLSASLSSRHRRTVCVVLGSFAAASIALAASAQTPPVAPPPTTPAAAAPAIVAGTPATYQVNVLVKGLRGRGTVLGGLYDGPAHWPEKTGTVARCALPVRGREGVCSFTIPARPGLYAAAFFHDEDGDREMTTGFLGIPTEGYAFSRDASAALSAPSFEAAAVRVPVRTPVVATMRY